MKKQPHILFCESPFQPNQVDEDYEDQFIAAKEQGFGTLLFSFEDLTSTDRAALATKRVKPNEQPVLIIYRGWMLTPEQYAVLYRDLWSKNYQLINTPEAYRNCHYLPDSLKFIADRTPRTVFQKWEDEKSLDQLVEKVSVFGNKPVILKDYVKSEKHDWETACFVADASDTLKLRQAVSRLVELRGAYLNEGIVVREFLELMDLAVHSKSGMPLTEEYRLFFCRQKLVGMYDYWEEGEYTQSKPDTAEFEEIAKHVESHFFSMDIARQKDGSFVIIELGDGQVAGLPDKTDRNQFYEQLRQCL